MPNLKEVKTRISSVISTQQITKAMKMVAASKLRKAQNNILQMRPYAEKLGEILENVSQGLDPDEGNIFGEVRDPKRILIIAITSDRGLCGGFNANVGKRTLKLIEDSYKFQMDTGDVQILSIGKKGRDYFKYRDIPVTEDFIDIFSNLSFESARKAAEYAMKGFLLGDFDKVEIVYNEFKNVATQVMRVEEYLPLKKEGSEKDSEVPIDYIFQPNKEVLVGEIIPKSLKVQLYKAILESNASEHGARMTAMDKATENASEILRELKITYNRTRQAAITKEILEIVAGAEALG
jgi:F-type H+-transporting ATPase subunit gamma